MPAETTSNPAVESVGPFQFSILILSVLALGAIAADTFLPLPGEVSQLLHLVDLVACLAFSIDFVVRFRAAQSKIAFMKWGWIDLLACIPTIEALRIGRLFAVFRVLRLLRGVRSLHRLLAILFVNPRRGGLASVGIVMLLLIVASSLGILLVERGDGANIRTASDAVWWSFATVTTVGYGDRYPVTNEGRIIAGALMVSGVGLFGALSGIVASLFFGNRGEEEEVLREIRSLRAEVEQLRTGAKRPPEARLSSTHPPKRARG
jgi:voltage-gated potassium channel